MQYSEERLLLVLCKQCWLALGNKDLAKIIVVE